jgi:hypothetical protein
LRKKEIVLLVFSSCFGITLCLVILYFYSLGSGFFLVTTKFDPELGWTNISDVSVVSGGKSLTTNSLGFRSDEVDSNIKHILIVGDSVAWGQGVSDNETVSYHLGKKITSFQTLNLGVPGYGTDQAYLRLNKYIEKLNPALIIVVIFTGNDLLDISKDTRYGKSKPFYLLDNKIKLENGKGYYINHNNLILTDNHLSQFSCMNLLSRGGLQWSLRFMYIRNKFCKQRYLNKLEIQYVFQALLVKFVQLSIKHNSKIMFVISPYRGDFKFSNITEYKNKIEEFNRLPPEKRNQLIKLVTYQNTFNQLHYPFIDLTNVQKYLRQANLQHIDFYKEIKASGIKVDDFYVDDAHYSPFGNKYLADTILKYIASTGLSLS